MEDKEPNKKTTAVFQESVDRVGNQALVTIPSFQATQTKIDIQTLWLLWKSLHCKDLVGSHDCQETGEQLESVS